MSDMDNSKTIQVLVADDSALVRAALSRMIESDASSNNMLNV